LGGSITGEHGVGVEKQEEMRLMYTDTELEVMRRIKLAHDPADLCNPKKIFPLSMLTDKAS
jgi:glycolate oxidase